MSGGLAGEILIWLEVEEEKVGKTAAGFSKSDCQGAGDPSSLSDFSGMRHIIVNGWQIVRL